MESLFRYVAAPSQCGYLPDRRWSLEYEQVGALSKSEYLLRMLDNWRRFGTVLFRPACADCKACRSIRVHVASFRPDRSQQRCRRANAGVVALRIGKPKVTQAKLALYDRYHAFQADHKGWPNHPAKDPASYADSFVQHPFSTEEWCYFVKDRLVGVGYVDVLPSVRPSLQGGLSAIYFFYEPAERQRSLGTWNVLSLIDQASRLQLPHVYLGYHVAGSASMEYKARFRPNERRDDDGIWRSYLP
jgi:arginine-tRNA-protein transferase